MKLTTEVTQNNFLNAMKKVILLILLMVQQGFAMAEAWTWFCPRIASEAATPYSPPQVKPDGDGGCVVAINGAGSNYQDGLIYWITPQGKVRHTERFAERKLILVTASANSFVVEIRNPTTGIQLFRQYKFVNSQVRFSNMQEANYIVGSSDADTFSSGTQIPVDAGGFFFVLFDDASQQRFRGIKRINN